MTSTLPDLLRRLEQHLLSALRLLSPAQQTELLSGLTTLLARCRVAAPDQFSELHHEFEALFTRTDLTLPPLRVTRTGGLESFTRGQGDLHTRGQANLFERLDTLERLVRGARPAQPKPKLATLYPDARAPKQVTLAQPFSIEAQICGTPPTPQPKHLQALQALPGPDGRVTVRASLLPGDGLRLRSPADAELSVLPGQDSHVLAFRVQATRAGPLSARVLFLAGTTSATIDLEFVAADTTSASLITGAATLPLGAPVPAGLYLTVVRRPGAGNDLVLHLRLYRDGKPLGEANTVYSAAFVTDLDEQLTGLGDSLGETTRTAWAATLRAFGRTLADDLLKNLRDALQSARTPGTRLIVQSNETELPLEMCLLEIDGEEVFLGEHFAVSRAEFGPAPPGTFRTRPAVLVSDPRSSFDLTDERSGLTALASAVESSDSYDDVTRRLEGTQDLGILHFAVHGTSNPEKPGSARLLLDGGALGPRLIPRERPERQTVLGRSLVFLNACRTGAAQSGLTREGGLVEAFHRAGVAAIVAPLWSVDSNFAGQFAAHVYNAVAAGTPLDEALRRARTAFSHEPDRLAYVLHAAPGCRPDKLPT